MWSADLVCVTERGDWVARFGNSTWSVSKQGRIEVVNRDFPREVLDELVVSGLAMVELERRRRSNNAAAAGAGGAGAGA